MLFKRLMLCPVLKLNYKENLSSEISIHATICSNCMPHALAE